MTASFGLGQIVGPLVAGYLATQSGDFFWASLLAAAMLVLAAAVARWSGQKHAETKHYG